MIIRHATEDDAPAMGEMMVATWLAAHKSQIPSAQWERRRQNWTPAVSARGWADTLRDLAAGGAGRTCIYLAFDENSTPERLVGIVMGRPAGNDLWPDAGRINALYVDVAYQRQGIGRTLLATAVAHLKNHGCDRIIIHCLDANKPACRFYETLGGRKIDEVMDEDDGFDNLERIYGWNDITPLLHAAGSQ